MICLHETRAWVGQLKCLLSDVVLRRKRQTLNAFDADSFVNTGRRKRPIKYKSVENKNPLVFFWRCNAKTVGECFVYLLDPLILTLSISISILSVYNIKNKTLLLVLQTNWDLSQDLHCSFVCSAASIASHV